MFQINHRKQNKKSQKDILQLYSRSHQLFSCEHK